MEAAWIALIATLFGGAGLKIVEGILGRRGKQIDVATVIREELRKEGEALKDETKELREEIRGVEKDLDQWKEKYFLLLQEFLEVKSHMAHQPRPVQNEGGEEW